MSQLALIILLSILIPAKWLTNFEVAKEMAKQENKYILLNFSGSDWCVPCIKMNNEVFEDGEFINLAANQLILVRADFPRSKKNKLTAELIHHNEALAEKYNPTGQFPLTLLLNPKGEIVQKWDGYLTGSKHLFLNELEQRLAH